MLTKSSNFWNTVHCTSKQSVIYVKDLANRIGPLLSPDSFAAIQNTIGKANFCVKEKIRTARLYSSVEQKGQMRDTAFLFQLIEAKKESFEKEMSQKRDDMSKDQADMLLEQHRQELEFLARSMDVEKQRQLASLSEKIAERKKRKAAALQQRHNAEMAKELMNQQDERQKVEDDKVRFTQQCSGNNFELLDARWYGL